MKRFLIKTIFVILFSCGGNERIIILKIDDGSGLNMKTNVVFKGTKIGNIKNIEIIGNNLIIKISIPNDFIIYTTTEFYIITTDIFGGKSIEIKNPEKGKEFFPNIKDTIPCKVKQLHNNTLIEEIFNSAKFLIDTIQSIQTSP